VPSADGALTSRYGVKTETLPTLEDRSDPPCGCRRPHLSGPLQMGLAGILLGGLEGRGLPFAHPLEAPPRGDTIPRFDLCAAGLMTSTSPWMQDLRSVQIYPRSVGQY